MVNLPVNSAASGPPRYKRTSSGSVDERKTGCLPGGLQGYEMTVVLLPSYIMSPHPWNKGYGSRFKESLWRDREIA